jgi:MarR family transcriptional regulator, organic hydroperoxide resistance regulator
MTPPLDHEPDPAEEHSRILMRVAPRISHLQREALNQLDPPLGITQYGVLARLGHGGTRSMSDMRARSTVTFSTLSEATSSLVRQGLVDRVRSEQDRRSVDLSLTAEGERVLGLAQEALNDIRIQLTDGLPEVDEEQLEAFWRPLACRVRQVLAEQSQRAEVVDDGE